MKIENPENIQVSFIGEGGGRAISDFNTTQPKTRKPPYARQDTATRFSFEIFNESNTSFIQVRRRTSTRGASPFGAAQSRISLGYVSGFDQTEERA